MAHTDGYCNLQTGSAQWADALKKFDNKIWHTEQRTEQKKIESLGMGMHSKSLLCMAIYLVMETFKTNQESVWKKTIYFEMGNRGRCGP